MSVAVATDVAPTKESAAAVTRPPLDGPAGRASKTCQRAEGLAVAREEFIIRRSANPGALRMIKRTLAWLLMALLALAVAGYAFAVLFAPGFRPSLVQVLLAERPIAAAAHFMGGAVALIVGAFQLNAWLRNRFLGVHRWLGRLYMLAVICGGVAGLALAPHAFGGVVAHLGFGLLAVCWLSSTLNAYRHVRQGDLAKHRSWMIRSYALTLAAVTLRIYLPSSQLAGFSMTVAYPAIAWLCWVPNLLIAEWFVRSRHSFAALPLNFMRTQGASRLGLAQGQVSEEKI